MKLSFDDIITIKLALLEGFIQNQTKYPTLAEKYIEIYNRIKSEGS